MSVPAQELLRISELAERAEVPVATVRHYLREGLLPEPVRTSRNMAYYPPEFVERIRLIKQLQEERFMPLRVIRDLLAREDPEPERLHAMLELEDRILERALATERQRVSPAEVSERYEIPLEVLGRLGELGVLTPSSEGYAPSDVRIVEAISRFRAGGYDETLGFTVYDTLRYVRALEPLVAEEVRVLRERLAGDVDTERALEIVEAGIGPLNDLIAALHAKVLVARLRRDTVGEMESDPERDKRASRPPGEGEPEHEPGEGEPEPTAGEEPGPLGNPASDEEALRQRQQERGEER